MSEEEKLVCSDDESKRAGLSAGQLWPGIKKYGIVLIST